MTYEKSLKPPAGQAVFETADGLKYWLADYTPTVGRQLSVITEDPEIAIHSYGGGGREQYGSYLFEYYGFHIGFVEHEIIEGYPAPRKRRPEDMDYGMAHNVVVRRITAVGTPVYDASALYKKDANGQLLRKPDGRFEYDMNAPKALRYVTGLNWVDYEQGKRNKFQSRKQQEAMRAIWLDLYAGLIGELSWIDADGVRMTMPNGKPAPRLEPRFNDDVIAQFASGELIGDNSLR